MSYPDIIPHWIDGKEVDPVGAYFEKIDPATSRTMARVSLGGQEEVASAVSAACRAQKVWRATSAVERGKMLRTAAAALAARREFFADAIAAESGKSKKVSLAEIDAAAECGYFFAGEGQRLYGKILQSVKQGRSVSLIREPNGVGALIVPFNNPAASVAWKAFPALLCGNAVVLKSHEYTPYTALLFARVFKDAGVPDGIFNVIQGTGASAGVPLVADDRIAFVSFTGSSQTGSEIIRNSADRLAKVSIESGGKNAIVVCDDADIDRAVRDVAASAFVDAGQRCAAASRVIVFESVYEVFKERFIAAARQLSVGTNDRDAYGAIISRERLEAIYTAVQGVLGRGAIIACGGEKLSGGSYGDGYFMSPTVLEGVSPNDPVAQTELFGPVVVLLSAKDYSEAVSLANSTRYGLSSAIHTKSIDRAQSFIHDSCAGVVRVNGPTHGSEPHMPFGGFGISGNGFREPGELALDFYAEWKQVSIDRDCLL